VVLYFNEITEEGVRFTIDMVQTLEDVLPQPAEIRVLDYYEPSVSCVNIILLDAILLVYIYMTLNLL